MTDISIVKTVSGDEIIGLVHESENCVIITDALVFVQRSSLGETGIQLIKYIPYAEDSSVKLDITSVVCITKASEAIIEFYKISVVYNEMCTKKIDASIREAASYMKSMLKVGTDESKEEFFNKMGLDLLNNFSSNTKN